MTYEMKIQEERKAARSEERENFTLNMLREKEAIEKIIKHLYNIKQGLYSAVAVYRPCFWLWKK